jgi:hypothetical protein
MLNEKANTPGVEQTGPLELTFKTDDPVEVFKTFLKMY